MMRAFARLALAVVVGSGAMLVAAGPVAATNPGVNGRIAFVNGGHLFVMNSDGTGIVDITPAGCADAYEPRWAPGGTAIAFIHRCGPSGSFDISTINPNGTGFTPIVATSGDDARVTFSPDGSQIAYLSHTGSNPDVFVANADGSSPVRLTTDPGWDDSPTWSPDGSEILFNSNRNGSRDLFVMDPDGTNVVRLTKNDGDEENPAWSPDGGRIAFDDGSNVFWMRADGTTQRQLTTTGGTAPDWSPDGTQITYADGSGQVTVANTDGTAPQSLTGGQQPSWEPVSGNGDASVWFTTGASAGVGQQLTLSGALTIPGANAGSKTLDVFATQAGKATTKVGSPITGKLGAFTFSTTPSRMGSVQYEVSWPGDATHSAASFTAVVEVTKRTSTLTVTTSSSRVVFGRSVTVTAHLAGGARHSVVAIYSQPANGKKHLLKRARVDSAGRLVTTATPRVTTTYSATYAGDARWKSASGSPTKVVVGARWTAQSLGSYGRSGKYALYHFSSTCSTSSARTCPTQAFALAPRYPNQQVVLSFQTWYRGHWVTHNYTWRLNSKSRIFTFSWYTNRDIVGVPHRVRATFSGDAEHGKATSQWVYWKVTG